MKAWLRMAAIVAAVLLPLSSQCERTKNILVLYRENPRLPGNIVATKAIQETIGQNLQYQVFDEYIEETRLETDFQTLAERIQQKYAGQPIDLIMTVGPRPFTFIRQYGERLFPSVPTVFSEVDLRFYPATLPPNTTGVSSSFDLSGTVDLILQLQPDTRDIFYVGGASPAELMLREEAQREFKPYAGRLSFTYLNDLPLPTLLDRIGQVSNHSVVLYSNFLRDASGHTYLTASVCPSIVASSNVPVYAIFDTFMGCGVVGGSLSQVEASAQQAAKLALRILHGENIARLPVEPGPPNRVFVDWRQLQKWEISEHRLPPGAVVMYRDPSLGIPTSGPSWPRPRSFYSNRLSSSSWWRRCSGANARKKTSESLPDELSTLMRRKGGVLLANCMTTSASGCLSPWCSLICFAVKLLPRL